MRLRLQRASSRGPLYSLFHLDCTPRQRIGVDQNLMHVSGSVQRSGGVRPAVQLSA